MKYRLLIIILFLIVKSSIGQEFTDLKGDYLGLKPPGLLPEVFAPGIVSDTSWREHCQVAFSPKGDEIYWSRFSEDKVNFLRFKYSEGVFTNPTTVNIYKDSPSWWPLYFSPDETYIIFPFAMEGGYGGLDLYVNYKDENDAWGKPINLGPEINTKTSERFPIVSPDGKYLFFMRHTPGQDFFWASAEIINELNK